MLAMERGVKVVANAGGLNPAGLATELRALAARLGVRARVAHVEGDDLLCRLDELAPSLPPGIAPVTANAYLGGWGIAEALAAGADVVVCGRVADASLVVGPAAWRFGWARDDWDRLAGAVVAGHVLECGTQATGGNYAFFQEIPDPAGREQVGPDRVRISGVRGEPAPPLAKVAVNWLGGFRNTMTLVLTGLDIQAKARFAEAALLARLGGSWSAFQEADVSLIGCVRPDPPRQDEAVAELRVTVKDPDPAKVGRAFSNAVVELALSNYPGCYPTTPPSGETPYGVYRAVLVPAETVEHVVVAEDQRRHAVAPPTPAGGRPPVGVR